MTVSIADIDRLCAELITPDFDGVEWTKAQGIEDEALIWLIESGVQAFKDLILEEPRPDLALKVTYANIFRVGWEAHKQFGKVGTQLPNG